MSVTPLSAVYSLFARNNKNVSEIGFLVILRGIKF
jgi:hypothetical protein